MQKNKKKNNYIYKAAWALIGIILVYAAFFTCANGFKRIAFSLDNNDIYEVNAEIFKTGALEGDHYEVTFPSYLNQRNEKYLRVKFIGITGTSTKMTFVGGYVGNNTFNPLCTIIDNAVTNGTHDYKLPSTDFSTVNIQIDGEGSYVIKKVQFRESINEDFIPKAITTSLATGAIYVMITLLLVFAKKKSFTNLKKSSPMELPNRIIAEDVTNYIPSKSLAIRILIFGMIILSLMIQIKGGETYYSKHFREYLLIEIFLILIIIFALYDKRSSRDIIKIDKVALVICATLSFYTLVSDILVDKTFRFSGTVIFVALFFFSYIWQSSQYKGVFFRNFEVAVQFFLFALILISIIKSNTTADNRFSGPITNPSIYALYLCGIWAVLLGSMESHFLNQRKKHSMICTIVEMLAVLILTLMSQSITPMLAMIAVTVLWVFRLLMKKRGSKYAISAIAIMFICALVIVVGIFIYAHNLDEESNVRIIAKFQTFNVTTLLSGRNYYWQEYLNHMNLFGHGKKPYLWEHRILPHNAIIGMAYMYGVPCIVSYILMMLMAVIKSWNYANTEMKYAAVPFYSIVSFIIMSMADNVEQPFVWLPWISCYLLMGPILMMPNETIENLRIKDN